MARHGLFHSCLGSAHAANRTPHVAVTMCSLIAFLIPAAMSLFHIKLFDCMGYLGAIAMMGFGVVIVRLRHFQPPLVPHPGTEWKLGLLFSFVGLITVLLSTQHYFAVRYDIDEDTYEPPDRWVLVFSLAVTLLGAGVIYFVFTAPINPLLNVAFE